MFAIVLVVGSMEVLSFLFRFVVVLCFFLSVVAFASFLSM